MNKLITPLFISLFYLVISSIWILGSDTLLASMVQDPHLLTQFQSYKGFFFISVSSLVIYLLVKWNNIKLIREKKQSQAIFESLYQLTGVLTPEGKIRSVNKTALKMIDVPAKDIIGKYFWETPWWTHDSGQVARLKEAIRKVTTTDFVTFQTTHHDHQKQLRYIDFSIKTMRNDKNEIILLIAEGRDITEEHLSELRRQEAEEKLMQSQKMEAIGTLAGGIAHDFNNILTGIYGHLSLAKMHLADPQKTAAKLDKIFQGAERARQLVRQILTFSRKGSSEKVPTQISKIIHESLHLIRATLPTSIEIKREINADKIFMMAVPSQMHQIIMNLCTNAYHAMKENGGTLGISLKEVELTENNQILLPDMKPGQYLQMSISDTGHGIPKKLINKIFEPYFTTKNIGEGIGLGLSTVHGIVKAHNGFINVYSEENSGTTFRLYFPIERDTGIQVKVSEKDDPIIGGNERIMLIDDETLIREALEEFLGEFGYQVTSCKNGIDALNHFTANPRQYDLILTDMTMPKMNGVELAEKILDIRNNTPIILCSGHSELINRDRALEMGIRSYFEKPIEMNLLAKTVRKVLDQHQTQ